MLTELFPKEGIGGGARGGHDSSLMDKNLLTRGQENYWNWGEGYYWTWFVSDGSKGPVFSHGARGGGKVQPVIWAWLLYLENEDRDGYFCELLN